MEDRAEAINTPKSRSLPTMLWAAMVAATVFIFVMTPSLAAQSAPAQTSSPSASLPQWQTDAGGKMSFDVASVKPNKAGLPPSGPRPYSNIPLGPQDLYSPTGGLLSATNMPLLQYMIFAYKLTPDQVNAVRAQLPKWASSENFDVQARATGNPTKDQFRLIMQALLADRFKMAIHYETKQMQVYALVLEKPGKLGPHLQPHPDDSPCSTAPLPAGAALAPPPTVAGGFPESCGAIAGWPVGGRIHVGARNMTLATMASSFSIPQLSGVDGPVVDKTGLNGKFDFILEFTPQVNGPLPPGVNFQPDESGPTFQEALKEQLGLKLNSEKGPVDVVVVDHVEEPSEN